jgi:tetratricopeptide (TPR) repeat protein
MNKFFAFGVLFCILFFNLSLYSQEKKPLNLELYFNRNLTEADRVKIKDNIFQYSQQIHVNPNNASLYVNRGVQYAYMGLYPDAISDYNKALKIDSTLSEAYYNRGIAKSRFAYTKGSCIDVKKAALYGLPQGKDLYKNKCGLFMKELGELP